MRVAHERAYALERGLGTSAVGVGIAASAGDIFHNFLRLFILLIFFQFYV